MFFRKKASSNKGEKWNFLRQRFFKLIHCGYHSELPLPGNGKGFRHMLRYILHFQSMVIVNRHCAPAVAETACTGKVFLAQLCFPNGGTTGFQHRRVGLFDIF